MSDRFDKLSPRDTAITLRSLRRRFGTVVAAASGEALSTLVDAPGPDGDSLRNIVVTAAQTASMLANDVERILDHNEPVIAHAAIDPSDRVFTEHPEWSLADAVSSLADDSERCADRLDDATGSEQSRSVAVVGGGSTTPLALAHEFARSMVGALTASERQIDWMRQQSA